MSRLGASWRGSAATSPERGVVIEIDGGAIAAVRARRAAGRCRAARRADASPASPTRTRTPSSARCAAARSPATGSFWTWREQMYALAETLDPDAYLALARATFAEMALAGITRRRRVPLPAPADLRDQRDGRGGDPGRRRGGRPADAARRLLPARRARAASATPSARRVGARGSAGCATGRAAAHRRGDPQRARGRLRVGDAWWPRGRPSAARRCTRTSPSSPPRTRPASQENGLTPTADARRRRRRLAERSPRSTRRTWRQGRRAAGLRATSACAPPPSATWPTASARRGSCARPARGSASGSDSQAFIDLFEEARAIELDERLATGVRGNHTPAQLLAAATAGGYDSLGWPDGGRIAAGRARRPRHRVARRRHARRHAARARRRGRRCSPRARATSAT